MGQRSFTCEVVGNINVLPMIVEYNSTLNIESSAR